MFETIVLALDGSASSDGALSHATALAAQHGSTVHVVHVVEILAGRGGGPLHLDEDAVKDKIRGQVADLVDGGIKAEVEMHSVMAGGPAHVVADVAGRVGADLIVTGTRGHTALAGVVLGSVTQRLLHLAQCPVLVVPHRAERSGDDPAAPGAAGT